MPQTETKPMASLWLLPAAGDEAMFVAAIKTLAARHGAPLFHPHLTLAGDLAADPAALAGPLADIAAASGPFVAPVEDIATSALFFRSYYAAFAITPPLAALREAAERRLSRTFGAFAPHISLLYGPVPPHAKQASASEWRARLAGRPIRFDRLAATNSANDVPVADWRIVAVAALGG